MLFISSARLSWEQKEKDKLQTSYLFIQDLWPCSLPHLGLIPAECLLLFVLVLTPLPPPPLSVALAGYNNIQPLNRRIIKADTRPMSLT